MKLDKLLRIDDVSSFLEGTQWVAFNVSCSKAARYRQIESVLGRFSYKFLKRKDKGVLIRFLVKITGYSRQQVTRAYSCDGDAVEARVKVILKQTNSRRTGRRRSCSRTEAPLQMCSKPALTA